MAEIFLHIGHGKTGSSYIQSLLNLSRLSLFENGLSYPLEKKDLLGPEKISSGNGRLIHDFGSIDPKIINPSGKSVIFSDEHFFRMLCDGDQYFYKLRKFFKDHGFSKVNVLLFTRNPVSHAASLYQQSVKRDGKSHSINEIFSSYNTPIKVLDLVQKLKSDDFFKLTVFNYSANRGNLIERFADWLGVTTDDFVYPKSKVINRSLTSSELYLQSVFNKYLGKSSALISDPLCEQLPDIKSDVVFPNIEVQNEMVNRLWPVIAKVNGIFPDQCYENDAFNSIDLIQDEKIFSKEQIDVICESLAARILEQRKLIQQLRKKSGEL